MSERERPAPPHARSRPAFNARSLIARKRDGGKLHARELLWLVRGFVSGKIADYQMAAFTMAVLLRGMDATETAALTLAMRDSGKQARIRGRGGPKIDKHSTGGVGDKVSICLAPIVAECGLRVPMIAGRGLGHTGGTLDKLEAIPGFRVELPLRRFEHLVDRHGFALIGQSRDLAPADRALYALRDVTATVESTPLITASILSKKLCEDLDALVLDVKVGRGAFMKTITEGRSLARSIVSAGKLAGLPTTALLTRMDSPLGRAVGNALETAEALRVLHGDGPDDLLECTLALGAEMLRAGDVERKRTAAERRMLAAIASGRALRRMRALVAAQHGDPRVVDEPDRLLRARLVAEVTAPAAGYVHAVDALRVAELALGLGAGRARADEAIDATVGVVLARKPGERVTKGERLAELHLAGRSQLEPARRALLAAYEIGTRRPAEAPLVLEVLR